MTLNDVMQVVINIPSGTPPYYVACSLCQLRGIDPHGQAMVAPVANWQAIIMERVLGDTLAALVGSPVGAAD